MGVFKLWQLLLTIAKPLTVDQLSGKILAVDASIWIVKIDSLYNTNRQKLKSILTKIMTLKRNNILPIFVFDGIAPAIKRRTLQERQFKKVACQQKQAKKKAQIEVMRLLQGDSRKQKAKPNTQKQKQQELSQIKATLQNLTSYNQQNSGQVSKQLLQKITMQSQILNHKYQLMLDITPSLSTYEHFVSYQDYQLFDIDRKKQYLHELDQISWRLYKKQYQKSRESMDYQEKLRQDLKIIQKKCKLRQEQDKYYRKLLQRDVKIENGYQIIQTIYNGRKMIQKKKIPDKNSNTWLGYKKSKTKHDFSSFNFKNQSEQQNNQNGLDPFLARFCNVNIPVKTQKNANYDETLSSQIKKVKQIQNSLHKIQKKMKIQDKPKKERNIQSLFKGSKKNESEDQQSQRQFQSSQSYFRAQFKHQNHKKQDQVFDYINKQQFQKQFQHQPQEDYFSNRDNLPQQASNDFLPYHNHSSDNNELQNLFRLLGIPFIIAPGQAEAQCAALQREGIVDGTITQDSDVFLFGGKNVYRGVFQNNIRYYNYNKMQEKLKLSQQKLIIFALLLGSDYALGVKGIGLINAMQILKVFGSFTKIQRFKNWAQLPDIMLPEQQRTSQLMKSATEQQKQFYELHKKFKNYWYIDDGLTNEKIKKAYLQPQIISHKQLAQMKNQGHFRQKQCNIIHLQKLLKEKLQIEGNQLEHYKKLLTLTFSRKRQANLYDFWGSQQVQMAKIRSKRLQKSIEQNNKNLNPKNKE